MKYRQFHDLENWSIHTVLVRVYSDGTALVSEPTKRTMLNHPLAVPEAIALAESLLGYREIAIRLEEDAEWNDDWGELA